MFEICEFFFFLGTNPVDLLKRNEHSGSVFRNCTRLGCSKPGTDWRVLGTTGGDLETRREVTLSRT